MGRVTRRHVTPGMVVTLMSLLRCASWKARMLLYATSKDAVTSAGSDGHGRSCRAGACVGGGVLLAEGGSVLDDAVSMHALKHPWVWVWGWRWIGLAAPAGSRHPAAVLATQQSCLAWPHLGPNAHVVQHHFIEALSELTHCSIAFSAHLLHDGRYLRWPCQWQQRSRPRTEPGS